MKRLSGFAAMLILVESILLSGYVLAQRPNPEGMMASAAKSAFYKIRVEVDKNRDGKISKAEFYAMYKDRSIAEKNYAAWDLSKDGYITEEEYVKAVVNIGKKKRR